MLRRSTVSFKRWIVKILSLAMILSNLYVVPVYAEPSDPNGGVSGGNAGGSTYELNADDLGVFSELASGEQKKAGTDDYFTLLEKVKGTESSKKIGGIDFNHRIQTGATASTSKGAIKIVTDNPATITVYANQSGGNTGDKRKVVVLNNSGTIVTQSDDLAKGTTYPSFELSLESAGTYYIGASTSGIDIYCLIVVETPSGSSKNPPTVTSVTATQDATDNSKVIISGTGTAGDSGSKYVIVRTDANNNEVELPATLDGSKTSFEYEDTLTASGTYAYKAYGKGTTKSAAVAATGSITYTSTLGKPVVSAAVDDGKITLSWKKVDEADTYDVTVKQGNEVLAGKGTTGITALTYDVTGLTNGTEYEFTVTARRTSDSASAVSDAIKAKPKAAEEGVTWFKPEKLTDASYTANTAYEDGSVFNLIATSSKNLNVETSDAKTATDGENFIKRLKLNGTGKITERAVQITAAEKSYIVVYAMSGGADTRTLNVTDSNGTVIDTISADGKTLAPSKAVILEAGTYYVFSINSGINIYGIKLAKGEPEKKPWSEVATPVIDSLTYDAENGAITMKYTAEFAGELGADSGIISLLRKDGNRYYEIDSKSVTVSGTATFTPPVEGTYVGRFSISRKDEADKNAEEKTVEVNVLPPGVPSITWLNNLGGGSVYVDWNNVEADQGYTVSYKKEGDASYTEFETGNTKGYTTVTGLTSGSKYTIMVKAVDSNRGSKAYERDITVGAAVQEWYADVYGSATSGTMTVGEKSFALKSYDASYPESKNIAPDVTDGSGTVTLAKTENGKIADSETGIQVYYTRINPNTENFKLTATFKVTDDGSVNNQSGFGIYAMDIAGLGTKDAKYFNHVAVGNFKMNNGSTTYHSNGVRLVTGYETYDPTNADGINLDNSRVFDYQKGDDTSVNGDTYTYTLEKTAEGFICSVEGSNTPITIDNVRNIMVQEDGSVVLGVAAARVGVEISNITFEKTPGSVSEGSVAVKTTPSFKVHSSNTNSTPTYEFLGSSNVAGSLTLYNGTTKLAEGTAAANKAFSLPVTLWNKGGDNVISYVFVPDKNTPDLISYAEIKGSVTVNYRVNGSENAVIYTSPNAAKNGLGTKADPKDLQTAINGAMPGQTIVMLNGTYSPMADLLIQRNVSGTESKMITLVAETTGGVTVNGDNMSSTSSLLTIVGSYWHIYGIEFCDTTGKGVSVCGNHNIVEMCTIHDTYNSGLQISRYSGEPNDKELWPAYNLIKNCESYDNCDPGRSDADGFAAKLTCGEGNVFDGCISHHNIDDGWDLYAKSNTGPIGNVVVKNCVAYSNGWLTSDESSYNVPAEGFDAYGEGNGFKLGGENMYGAHQLINCVSFNNHAKGITSNSGPDCQVISCTSFNNGVDSSKDTYNLSLYTKASNDKAWVLEGTISLVDSSLNSRIRLGAELGSSNGIIYSLRSATNYIYDGSKSLNTEGVEAVADWFESVDVTKRPIRNSDGSIDMHGLLVLKSTAPADSGARINNASSTQPEIIADEETMPDQLAVGTVSETIPESVLTDELKNATGIETVAQLVSFMESITVNEGIETANIKVVDIEVIVSFDGGKNWVPATEENFPTNGVDVLIPYPAAVKNNSNAYEYVVTHLVTMKANGLKVGDTETINARKTDDGLVVHIMSASPFAIGWKIVESSDSDSDDDDDESSYDVHTTNDGDKGSTIPLTNTTAVRMAVISSAGDVHRAANVAGDDYIAAVMGGIASGNSALKLIGSVAMENNLKVAAAFDVSLFRMTKNGVFKEKVTSLNAPIRIMFNVPDGIDVNKYDFGIIRIHDGKAQVMADLDSDVKTVTMESDKFSAYAIVYGEKGSLEKMGKAAGVSGAAGTRNGWFSPKTYDYADGETKILRSIELLEAKTDGPKIATNAIENAAVGSGTAIITSSKGIGGVMGLSVFAAIAAMAAMAGAVYVSTRYGKRKRD
ncbi:MAG: fibronectin type III domain-containing protein [Lachnospiraceae bacterium]|nr:fibronectin type III domain-containing protein [Lachnospiraceae bacterium]